MSKIVATGKVEDLAKWEAGFSKRGELFASQSINSPVHFTTSEKDSQIVILFEVSDTEAFFKAIDSPATAEAMAEDGVNRETVRFFVLDKDVRF